MTNNFHKIGDWVNKLITKPDIKCYDNEFVQSSIMEVIEELKLTVKSMEDRIIKLEDENIQLTNEIYRLENSLEQRIDILGSQNLTYDPLDNLGTAALDSEKFQKT